MKKLSQLVKKQQFKPKELFKNWRNIRGKNRLGLRIENLLGVTSNVERFGEPFTAYFIKSNVERFGELFTVDFMKL